MRPVMFETAPASDDGSRRALLDRLARCDALVLLLGHEYGEPTQRGVSPTEEEFNEAVSHGIPVLALVQAGAREPAQDAFVARVRGTWEEGKFAPEFNDASDVGFVVVSALNDWRSAATTQQTASEREARVRELAEASHRRGYMASGSKLRVIAVPILGRPLLDAVSLGDQGLPDELATAARMAGLVSNDMALTVTAAADHFALHAKGSQWEELNIIVGHDGAIAGEGSVSGDQSNHGFGGMVVMADRARDVIRRSLAFAELAWKRIDQRDEVRQVLVAAAVPNAEQKSYATQAPGNTMSMAMSMPELLVVPPAPLVLRRADLASDQTVDRLQAELRRGFELGRAVIP